MGEITVKELEKLARPLIEWLNNNHHPHMEIVITNSSVKLLEAIRFQPISDYIKD